MPTKAMRILCHPLGKKSTYTVITHSLTHHTNNKMLLIVDPCMACNWLVCAFRMFFGQKSLAANTTGDHQEIADQQEIKIWSMYNYQVSVGT